MTEWHDVGDGHAYSLYVNSDRVPIGALVKHPIHEDDEVCRWRGECVGSILFAVPEEEPYVVNGGKRRAQWDVVALDPLHVEPSLACHCGDHGYIRGGRWEAA
jgi:hypothetical protein